MKRSQSLSQLNQTSDGVSGADWYLVRCRASEVVNATIGPTSRYVLAQRRLMGLLSRLIKKYGKRPSLLATKADYMSSPRKRVALWEHAFRSAENATDHINCVLIATSLVEFYFEDALDETKGNLWLTKLEGCLLGYKDKYAEKVLAKYKRDKLILSERPRANQGTKTRQRK